MKNSLISYLLGFFVLISCCKAIGNTAVPRDSSACLEIDGKIPNACEGEDATCLVELFTSNTVVSWATLKEGKKTFRFLLKKNTVYTIRISKRGYMSRLICIDTKVSIPLEDLYRFAFETRLLKTSECMHMNKELLDLPVALIYFDPQKDDFVYDKEYTSRAKKELAVK